MREVKDSARYGTKHGTTSRYRAGCRCAPCSGNYAAFLREANRKARQKREDAHGRMVPIGGTRYHLQQLSAKGIGRRAVSEACDVPTRTIDMIRNGRWKRIRQSLAERICAVTMDARADGALVSAARCWQRIGRLRRNGLTQREIAKRLGYKGDKPHLGLFKTRVTARNELRVEKLFHLLK